MPVYIIKMTRAIVFPGTLIYFPLIQFLLHLSAFFILRNFGLCVDNRMQYYRDDEIPPQCLVCPIFSGIEISPVIIPGREHITMSTVGLAVYQHLLNTSRPGRLARQDIHVGISLLVIQGKVLIIFQGSTSVPCLLQLEESRSKTPPSQRLPLTAASCC